MRRSLLREFLRLEAAGGFLLFGAAALALIVANTPLAWLYDGLLDTSVTVQVGALKIAKPLLLWINDGLMAVFFLLVGLEIKREVAGASCRAGRAPRCPSSPPWAAWRCRPRSILLINAGSPATLRGWAIPTATDIAFALGVLTLLGPRAPAELKIFLPGARDHRRSRRRSSSSRSSTPRSCRFWRCAGRGRRRWRSRSSTGSASGGSAPYLLIGVAIWVCVLKSGIHATLAGVAVALLIPTGRCGRQPAAAPGAHAPPVGQLRDHADLRVRQFRRVVRRASIADLVAPLPLGIAAALFVGKQVGVFAASWAAVRARALPPAAWRLLDRSLWREPAHRHRLHDEPVYRVIGLRRSRARCGREAGRFSWVDSFRTLRLSAVARGRWPAVLPVARDVPVEGVKELRARKLFGTAVRDLRHQAVYLCRRRLPRARPIPSHNVLYGMG